MNIAAGTFQNGSYEYDLNNRQVKLVPDWPKNKPVSTWKYVLKDEGHRLLLQPLDAENGAGPGCGYVLRMP